MQAKWIDPRSQKPYYFLASVVDTSNVAQPNSSQQTYQLSALKSGSVTHILLDFKIEPAILLPTSTTTGTTLTNAKFKGAADEQATVDRYLQSKVRILMETSAAKAVGIFDIDPSELVSYGNARNLYIARLKTPSTLPITGDESLVIKVMDVDKKNRIPRAQSVFVFGIAFVKNSKVVAASSNIPQNTTSTSTNSMQTGYAGLTIKEFDYGVRISETQGNRPLYRTTSSRDSTVHAPYTVNDRFSQGNYIPEDIRTGSRYFDGDPKPQDCTTKKKTNRLGTYKEKYHKDPLGENRAGLRIYDPRPEGTPPHSHEDDDDGGDGIILPSAYWKKDEEVAAQDRNNPPRHWYYVPRLPERIRMITTIIPEGGIRMDHVIDSMVVFGLIIAIGYLFMKKIRRRSSSNDDES